MPHAALIKPVYRCRRVQIYLWDLKCLHLAVIESNVCRSSPHIAEIHISSRARVCVCAYNPFGDQRYLFEKTLRSCLDPLFTDCPPHIKSQPTDGWPAIASLSSSSLGGRRYCYHYISGSLRPAQWARSALASGQFAAATRPTDTQKPHCFSFF